MVNINIVKQKWVWRDRCILMNTGGTAACIIDFVNVSRYTLKAGDALIWSLSVNTSVRKKGIATDLIKTAEQLAVAQDCRRTLIEWNELESQQWVLEWYKRLGYKIVDRHPHEIRLQKLL